MASSEDRTWLTKSDSFGSVDLPSIVDISDSPHCPEARMETGGQSDETILSENPDRFTMFPVQYRSVWGYYKKTVANFWAVEQIDMTHITHDWCGLTEKERRCIISALAFFLDADRFLLRHFSLASFKDVEIPEVRAFYSFQMAKENVHVEMYSLLIDTFLAEGRRDQFMTTLRAVPLFKTHIEWAAKWMHTGESLAQRLVVFVCMGGILFSGSLSVLLAFKRRKLIPGLTSAAELIAKDIKLHIDFACHLYTLLHHRLPESVVHTMLREAIEVEMDFCREVLKTPAVGIEIDTLQHFLQFIGDKLLSELRYSKIFQSTNPFVWMDEIWMQGKSNNGLEKDVMSAQGTAVIETLKSHQDYIFKTDEDF